MPRLLRILIPVLVFVSLAAPSSADTPVSFGAQFDIADDFDFGIGARAAFDTGTIIERTRLVGSFDFYFPDGPVDFWELNANGHYLFDLPNAPVGIYAGGGLHIAHVSVDADTVIGTISASDTEVGLNILGGIDFKIEAPVSPFLELKIELGGAEQFIFTGGVGF